MRKPREEREKEKGSLTALLMRNYIWFTLIIVVAAIAIFGLTSLALNSMTFIQREDQLQHYQHLLEKQDYKQFPTEKVLGTDSYFEILDMNGQVIYNSSIHKNDTFTREELNLIPKFGKNQYSQISQFIGENGQEQILVEIMQESADEAGTSGIFGYFGASEQVDFVLMAKDRTVLSTTLALEKKQLTEKDYQLLTQTYQSDYLMSYYDFKDVSGEEKTLLVYQPYYSERESRRFDQIIMMGIVIFLTIYIALLIVFVFFFRRKVNRPLKLLDQAISSLAEGQIDSRVNYEGPKEFVDICSSFNTMADQLRISELKRKTLEEEKQKMLADISHDLKTPITVIQGYSKAIVDGLVEGEKQTKYLETIYTKSSILNQLINSFYEYSKIQHPQFQLQKRTVDFCEFSRSYIAAAYNEFEIAGYGLEVLIPEESILVEIDPAIFTRALDNLVGNFLKYNPPGTRLLFEITKDDNTLICYIADDGVGVPLEKAQTLFAPFVTGDEARSNGQGSGLGLAIVAQIMQEHGGSIELIKPKRANYKTEFRIVLPLMNRMTGRE